MQLRGTADATTVAHASVKDVAGRGVRIVPPVDEGRGPRLAPSGVLLDAVRPYLRRGRRRHCGKRLLSQAPWMVLQFAHEGY